MNETLIQCPNCGAEIPVSEVLRSQIRGELEKTLRHDHEARLEQAVSAAEVRAREQITVELKDLREQITEKERKAQQSQSRELELRKRARELEQQQQTLAQDVRQKVTEELRQESEARIQTEILQARAGMQEQMTGEFKLLQEQLEQQKQKVQQAQAAELTLRKEKASLEQRARELDLEVARKLDEEKAKLEMSIRQSLDEAQSLKLKEKEKQISDLRLALEDAKRRSELGSQELQGETLELDMQAELERQFPHDRVEPVAKGMRGADIIQGVRNGRGEECGTIIWETKNTKNWQPAWLQKLRDDQRTLGAAVSVLVSIALPDGIKGFGRLDGVWVSDLKSCYALATVLREQIIQVAFAHTAAEGKNEKMDMLYRYLAGDPFRQKVQGIVEAFTALQQQLSRERRAMEKQWREREKQIERVITNTVGMYGEMSGILGGTLPRIPALELDDEGLLDQPREQSEIE